MAFKPFFPPSAEITSQLIRRMGKRRAMTLLEEAGAAPASEPADDDAETSDELLTSIVAALSSEPESNPEADWREQRWLSGVIYHFLGFQAGRARRGGRNEFSSADIVEGMRDRLGLFHAEDAQLLEQLAGEFSDWLREQDNAYAAGWGNIVPDRYERGRFRLEPLPKAASESPLKPITAKALAARGGLVNADLIEQ